MTFGRSSEPVAYGIDFGTTNSSIAVAYRDRIEVILVETGSTPEILPSIIYLNRDRTERPGRKPSSNSWCWDHRRRNAGDATSST